MSSILEDAQAKARDVFQEKGNTPLASSDLPWTFAEGGLVITAQREHIWTWKLLNEVISGLRYCAFRKGVFEEILVTGMLGPGTPGIEEQLYMSLLKQEATDAVDGYSATCVTPGTTTTLKLKGGGRKMDPFAMGQILDKAEDLVDSQKGRGDRHLTPQEIPWIFSANGLVIKAQMSGWSLGMLKNTIEGLRSCSYAHGMYEEVFVIGIMDPRGMDPNGNRYLSLVNGPKGNNGSAVDAPKPLPPDLQKCTDPNTGTRLLYQLKQPVAAYAMQTVLDGALTVLTTKIIVAGESHQLTPSEVPWTYKSTGLIITANYEGWTWGFLNKTVAAIKACPFRRGEFGEVEVVDVIGRDTPRGQRYLDLRIIR